MLAPYMLWRCVCLCACPAEVDEVETAKRIELMFGIESFFDFAR